MRRLAKSNKFNKGFSLVEVLVAMAVITLISIPLLRTFITSAQINNKAKKLQNATDIAQNVSENFTTIPLLTLMQDNDGSEESEKQFCGEYFKNDNHVIFKNIGDGSVDENNIPYFKGNDNEKFYVTVTMRVIILFGLHPLARIGLTPFLENPSARSPSSIIGVL